MPIIDLQRSLRRLGKIRMGEQVEGTTKDGKKCLRPAKLKEWRLTSPNAELLAHAAEVYGGDVAVWEGAPGEGKQYQLYTTSEVLDIVIPPGDPSFMQYYEMWSAGGCQRRCDGQTETLSEQPCMCPVDAAERDAAAKTGKACKMTTRLSVLLPKIPDLGTWMLESHGFYAAVELGGLFELKQQRAPGAFIDARLRIEPRTVKRGNETRHYMVPVIELPDRMIGELVAAQPGELSGLASGDTPPAPLDNGHAIAAPAKAIDAGPTSPPPAAPPPPAKRAPSPPAPRPATPAGAPPLPTDPAPADERAALHAELDALGENEVKLAKAKAKAAKLPNLDGPAFTTNHVEALRRVMRQARVLVAMKAVGVISDDARHELISQATGGATTSSAELNAEQCDAVLAACQEFADAERAAGYPNDAGDPF